MYKRMLSLCLLLTLLSCSLPALADPSLASAPLTNGQLQRGVVRVRLAELEGLSTLNLTFTGSYTLSGQSSHVFSSGASAAVHFNKSSGQWSLTKGGETIQLGASFQLYRQGSDGQSGVKIAQARVPGNLYPGDLQFIAKKGSSAYTGYVVAHVYLEDYLYGVLPYEMGNSSGLEALKAQTVAARTYTMLRMSAAGSASWDVVNTTADQVYSGTPSGNANCRQAVDETRGIVIQNGGVFTNAYYTASNGGQTENVQNAWGVSGSPYLVVKDDPYDLANPDSRTVSFTVNASGSQSSATLGRLLNQKAAALYGSGASVTAVTAVTPHSPRFPSPSRLYTKLDFSAVISLNGQSRQAVLTFDIFKELEGPLGMSINSGSNELWSVSETGSGFRVTARRYGHGIGMSQRGAMQMARLGYTYDQILAFYFEGCTRVKYPLSTDTHPSAPDTAPAPSVTAAPVLPLPDTGVTARVNVESGSLNLRAAPSASAAVLRGIPKGTVLPIYAETGDWCQTAYQGDVGYVALRFLAFNAQEAPPAEPTSAPLLTARVTTGGGSLNLRSAPVSSAKVLLTIPQNAVISVLDRGSSWCQASYNGISGYVMTSFLTFPGEAASTPTSVPKAQPAFAAGGATAQVITSDTPLNLRSAPRTDAQIIAVIPRHEWVTVQEQGDEWCLIAYNGQTGYAMARYLSIRPAASSPSKADASHVDPTLRTLQTPVLALIASTASSLNLRSGCSTEDPILMEMPKGDYLTITAAGDTWCAVTYAGQSGYCMTKYLEFDLYE